jgi:hypothetical protein
VWKYRSAIIFAVALAFAARSLWFADFVSLGATLIFLSAHYVDRFFGADRFESKAVARVATLEEELKVMKSELGQIRLAAGIRGR